MIEDAEVAGYDLVLQESSGWDIDPLSVISDDDNSSLMRRMKNIKNPEERF